MRNAIALGLVFLASIANAEKIVVFHGGKAYLVELLPSMVIPVATTSTVGGGPTVPNPPQSSLASSVKTLTDNQADPEIKVVLAAIYQSTADKVLAGTLKPAAATAEIRRLSGQLLKRHPKWKAWTDGVGNLLDDLARRGKFDSQGEVAGAFSDVSAGIKASLESQRGTMAVADRALFNRGLLQKILPILLELLSGDGEFDFKSILAIVLKLL